MNKNLNTMKNHTCTPRLALVVAFLMAMGFSKMASAQTPTVTVRFANPTYACSNNEYCVDVEFQADQDSVEIFGMNVRFFYDDAQLEIDSISDFQGGYGSPTAPVPLMSAPGFGTTFFGFPAPGVADWVNTPIQLVDDTQTPIYISTTGWTKLFQICFNIDAPLDDTSFCPPLVWDLELNPANGGYLGGDDGVVITVVADPPAMSSPANEAVVQYNWMYTGDGSAPPYGAPVENECLNLLCIPELVCAPDVTIQCTDSTSPDSTGIPTAMDGCLTDITISFTDSLDTETSLCPQEYIILRTWIAANECGNADTCLQTITVIDTVAPSITCPVDVTIECDESTLPDSTGLASATDLCDPTPEVTYNDVITPGACPQELIISRTWTASDSCGNSNTCLQTITVQDTTPPVITLCPADVTIECTDSTSPDSTGIASATDNCDPAPVVTYSDVITPGACPQELSIARTWLVTDACGNSTTCLQTIFVQDTTAPDLTCPVDVTIECTDSTLPDSTGLASATDNCDPTPEVTYNDVTAAGACPQEYTINRTWTATDSCGNASTCLQIITIEDSTPPVITECPADVTIECTDSTSPDSTGIASATDNCDPAPVVTYSDVITPGACPQELSIARTWLVTDACGNSTTCLQTIFVQDTTPPDLTCPADVTIECTDSTLPDSTGLASATDNCDPTPEVTYNDVTAAGTCPQEYTINRTWTATDSCGNTSTCLQIVTIEDSTPPVITECPADVTIECTDSTSPDSTGIASATDNCDPAPVVTYSDVITPGACPQELSIARTWLVTDACGNSTTCLQTISVQDTTAPDLTCPVDVTIECTDSTLPDSTGLASATDNCDPTPEVTYNDVTAAGACPQEYTINRTWTATDSCGNTSTCLQIVTIEDSTPPVITECPVDVTIECTDSTSPDSTGIASATDNCDPAPVVTYSEVVTPGACPQELSIARTWLVTDACGNSTTCLQTITVQDTTAPDLTCPTDVTIECTESTSPDVTGIASATDNCDPEPVVTFSDVVTPGACPQELTIVRTWLATDACGNSSTCLQNITVDDSTPPVIVCPEDLTLECTDPVPTDIATATDNCSTTVSVTYNDVMCDNPVMGFTDIYDFSFWTTTIPAEGGSVTTMSDNEVMLVSPDDISLECDTAAVQFSITIPSTGQIVFDWNYSTNDTDGPSFDPFGYNLNGTFFQLTADNGPDVQSGTTTIAVTAGDIFAFEQQSTDCIFGAGATTVVEFFACVEQVEETCTQLIIRTHTATDECGNESNCSQTLLIVDTTPPVITCPLDVTIECDASTVPDDTGIASATDNCDTTPEITYSEVITPSTVCPQELTITRTWVATDACDNSSTCIQVITVDDSTPPVITCPADVTIECTDSTLPDSTGLASATDNCDAEPIVTYSDVVTPGACPQELTIARTWLATDACGNSSTCLQTITVQDTTAPALTCPADVTIECTDSTLPDSTGLASATDNCDPTPEVTYNDVTTAGACPQEYTINRTWTATDSCGNTTTCLQIVTIEDSTPPVITECPADVTIECTESTSPDSTGIASATDNCDPAPVVTYSDAVTPGACPQGSSILRTWLVTDACGNTTTCEQNILVEDSTPPTITCPVDVTIECDESTSPDSTGIASATDNCDPAPAVTYNDVTTEGACPQAYTITRTWTTTDACGNATNCIQVVTVEDSTPPVITECPADVTIECTESTSPDSTGIASATDNCDPAPVVTYSEVITPGACPQEMSIARTWLVTDACGNSTTCLQTILVDDSTPPVITCPADVTIECTDSTIPDDTGIASATDNCDTAPIVTYSEVVTPGACPQELSIVRTWLATDACGNSSTCDQTITVQDTVAPVVTCPEDVTIDCLADSTPESTGFASATDNCDQQLPGVEYSDVTIEDNCPVIIERTWTSTDACGNIGSCVQTITIVDTTPPTITCPTDVTVECAADVPVVNTDDVTVSDDCNLVTVTHQDDIVTDSTCVNRYNISRVYLATDDCGNTSTCAQVIAVFDDTPPTLTCPTDVTVECASEVPAEDPTTVTATDNCAGVTTVTTLGDVITNMTCTNRFTLTRTYQASDACGNTATCTQIINVFDSTPPTITCPANVTVACASQVPPVNTGSVGSSDNCGGTATVTHLGDVITGQLCPNIFTLTRTYQAVDACGNSASCSQIITVFDNVPPMIACPPDIAVPFGSDLSPTTTGTPTGTDNCGGTPVFTFTDVSIAGACAEEFMITRTWTGTDACGVMITCLQTIAVDGNCDLDLALTKTLIGPADVQGGDNVVFNITILNEGEATVGSVTITDYIPLGFTLNDPDWTPGVAGSTGQSASIVLSVPNGGLDGNGLNPGEFVTVQITLLANEDVEPSCYLNIAEISTILDLLGNDVTDQDIDSDADDIDTNDPLGEDDINDAVICVAPQLEIEGDFYVCPGELVTYCVTNFNFDFEYQWVINNGGEITATTGECIEVQWQDEPGGPFQISVNAIACAGCNTVAFANVYIQGVETLSCNDHVQISLGDSCETVVLSGMILEGEAEGNNNYFVIITDENGNVIPDATLTSEHVGECFTVMVANECNDQSCWGTICVEDKIPPVIECTDVTVSCGSSLEPVFEPAETGTASLTEAPGLPIGPNAGTVTTHEMVLDVPSNAVVTDVNITIDLDHTWVGDLTAELISPSGTTILLADQICGSVDNWELVVFDDQAGISVTDACNPIPPALDGSVIPQGTLSSINGQSAVGTWRVVITDQVGGDGGTLNLVTLDVDYFLAVPTAPTATDACGEVTLTYTDVESGDACEELLLTRTWVATDGSGNTATCVQTITITPLTLDNVDFPEAYVGVCGESIHPDHTGWPTVDGTPITDENDLCNIFVGYWDKVLNECGGGSKIVRTWTVLNWCTVEFVEAVQVIKLEDNVGPELTCPEDFEVGTDFWYCFANVSVPKPIAVDVCSEIATYELESTSGIIVSFGNNFVINGLEIGTHTVTWIVTDECGNSSTCSFNITVVDDVVPVANCDLHTIVSLTNDGPSGITLVPATVFDDGSYDNCGPVTFRARRMDSCIDFDWTTEGACIDDVPGGIPPVNSRDRGTVHRPCVPFACCDVGAGPVMVELEVTDAAGNVNYCMVEATVQDKISPLVICPPDIIVSCDFWFNVEEGTFGDSPLDHQGNGNGNLDEDPLSAVFGNMFDAFTYNDDESVRQDIVINDPGNDDFSQPHFWGIDGWADDNCEVNLSVRVRIIDDCSGDDLPGNAPDGAVKLIERRFSAVDGNEGNAPGTCTQRIWVVDFDPFYITDNTCNNPNPQDGVIWPCDVLLTTCPEDLGNTGEPTVFDDACSLIGVTYEDQRFDFVDGACFKILREWAVIDWCQYDPQTGAGLWHYTQVIKVHDQEGPEFAEDCVTEVLCVADTGVTLPANNQAFLGEDNPLASSCSAHLNLRRTVHETCSDVVTYDVKIYPFNGTDYILVAQGTAPVDSSNNAILGFDTRQSTIQSIRLNGIPYNSPFCGDYHRILWTVEDGCGNFSTCEYLFRLEDCKQPSPVCINGLSTVVMPIGGEVTVWAKDFNASSFDDCTASEDLLYSFSGDSYQPSYTYDCDNVPAFNVEIATQIWVADGGTDDNCNGIISWEERNKDYCTTTIVITDNNDICGGSGSVLEGEILTEHTDAVGQVTVTLSSPGHFFPQVVTAQDGKFTFTSVPYGDDYTITPERNDGHRNGVSTLDLVRIQKHLLGKELFTSPYQYIAADANNTESISAIDLIEIRKLILGIYTEYPSNKSWRFVEKGFQMNNEHPWPFGENIGLLDLIGNVTDNDFIGVKIGDVNNSVQANANQVLPRSGRRVLTVEMDAPANVEAGDMVQVKLTLPEMVEGFQWTLETDGLAFESINSEVMKISDNHVGILHDGVMTMSWNAEDASSTGQVMYLNFIATASGNISGMIHMTSKVTEAEAYTLSGEILDVKLGHTGLAPEFALYQNKPNPWNEFTTIGFDLPADDVVKFTIFEASGKVVKTIESEFKAGYNTITLRANELPASGVMYYRLESGEYSASKKMVLIK